jgi:uncharacterized damage-inducible protein DinB
MSAVLPDAFQYNRWANLHLLDVCSTLDDGQLQLTTPGTYGTIAATLQHMLAAEQRYAKRLVGTEPRLSENDDFPGVAALKEHARRSGQDLIDGAAKADRDGTYEGKREGQPIRIKNWVVITQAIHHGNDHRAQICTILGQNGISVEDIDVWAYAETHQGYEQC